MGIRQSKIKVGDVFGRLVVKSKLPRSEYDTRSIKRTLFLCSCECGGEKIIDAGNLKKGTKSCGCLQKENARKQGKIQRTNKTFLNNYYGEYIRSARYRKMAFDISLGEFSDTVQKACNYCGREPSLRQTKNTVGLAVPVNGVDRVDSSKGYTLCNIVPCCQTCNKMKLDSSLEEFIMQVFRITVHQLNGTQAEHREVAVKCREELMKLYPFLKEFYVEKINECTN